MPTSVLMEKCNVLLMHNGMLFHFLKKESNFLTVTTYMNLANIILSEISQEQTNKAHVLSLMWKLN
jgi:hypothetical protein